MITFNSFSISVDLLTENLLNTILVICLDESHSEPNVINKAMKNTNPFQGAASYLDADMAEPEWDNEATGIPTDLDGWNRLLLEQKYGKLAEVMPALEETLDEFQNGPNRGFTTEQHLVVLTLHGELNSAKKRVKRDASDGNAEALWRVVVEIHRVIKEYGDGVDM